MGNEILSVYGFTPTELQFGCIAKLLHFPLNTDEFLDDDVGQLEVYCGYMREKMMTMQMAQADDLRLLAKTRILTVLNKNLRPDIKMFAIGDKVMNRYKKLRKRDTKRIREPIQRGRSCFGS